MSKVGGRFVPQLIAKSVVDTQKSKAKILNHSALAAHARKQLPVRSGVLGYKRGMAPYFSPEGKMSASTVIEIDRCQVTDVRTLEKNGYWGVQVGVGSKKYTNVSRPLLGHFARAQVAPKLDVAEFTLKGKEGLLPLGTVLGADHLVKGQYVDVTARSKGKGFAGVMKRWNFKGLAASHGVSGVHRSGGSTGQNTDPARVFPGKKMAGHMGFDYRTVQGLKVLDVDAEHGLVIVQGHVPGAKGRLIHIRDSCKYPLPENLRPKTAEETAPTEN